MDGLADSSVTFGTYPDDFSTKCNWKSNYTRIYSFVKFLVYTVLTIMFRGLSIVRHHYKSNNLKILIKIDCDSFFFSVTTLQFLEGFLNKNIEEEEGP